MDYFKTSVDEKGIALLSFSRPPVNAFNNQAYDELARSLAMLNADNRVRGIILYTPDKWFSVGNDVKEAAKNPTWETEAQSLALINAVTRQIDESRVPIIAAVRGYTVGIGIGFAMACDLLIASDTTKIAISELKVGILGGWSGRFSSLVPENLLRYMVYSSKPVDIYEIAKYGGILKVVPDDQLLETAYQVAVDITRNGPNALHYARRAMNIMRMSGTQDHVAVNSLLKEIYFSEHMEERREALNAFQQKREPKFTCDEKTEQ